jgi:hypothetical protein
MKIYYKKICNMDNVDNEIYDKTTDTIFFINIDDIEYLFKYVGTLYESNALYKFVICSESNDVYMITFDNVFDIDYTKINEFDNKSIIYNSIVKVDDLDCIIKYDDYYTYVGRDNNKYIITYDIYERSYKRGAIVPVSKFYIRKEEDKDSVLVLQIQANYRIDEDQGIYYTKAGNINIGIINCILEYEEKSCSDFYVNYCHMNTSEDY